MSPIISGMNDRAGDVESLYAKPMGRLNDATAYLNLPSGYLASPAVAHPSLPALGIGFRIVLKKAAKRPLILSF
ncbi:MAG: hypothetical protein CTY19_18665 [Methylomonas sp.]|nr:MAG: hypothetical protein CTY19_18665 [Methylomonas sp.]